MEIQTVQQKIEEGIDWFDANHRDLADAKAKYEQRKDFGKTQLAICEMEEAMHGDTQAMIARRALSSDKYQGFLKDLDYARIEFLRKKAEYDAKTAKFEGLRSLNKNIS